MLLNLRKIKLFFLSNGGTSYGCRAMKDNLVCVYNMWALFRESTMEIHWSQWSCSWLCLLTTDWLWRRMGLYKWHWHWHGNGLHLGQAPCSGWPWPSAETLRVSCILSINMPLQWSEGLSDLCFSLSMISSLLKVESVNRLIRKKHLLVVAHKIEIYTSMHVYINYSAADPEGGINPKERAPLIIWPKFPENSMKMKIGQGGASRIKNFTL